jgi:twitching motility protein PilT
VEQPIEYIFEDAVSHADFDGDEGFGVHQREVGVHVPSFQKALRDALRQDPEVIYVGELRDKETTTTALDACDTGHTVISTLHTGTVERSVERLIAMCDKSDKSRALSVLSSRMQIVLAQRLVPHADGERRIALHEVLVHSDAVRSYIMEEKFANIRSELQLKKSSGNISFEDSAKNAYDAGLISAETYEPYETKNS